MSPAEQAALARIPEIDAPDRLRALIANAQRMGSAAVEEAAFARLVAVQPEAEPGSFEHDVWQSIYALEELLREERGRTTLLSRTRQKIAKDGEAVTVADLTLKPDPSDGFYMLVERGRLDLLFEAVALRHPARFEPQVLDAARARIELAQSTAAQA